ncbi:MAG TPA: hypothetical protein PLV57_05790 [Phycisphaerae bacterium]|nr:hypothetical protein [Phycisphaerae bacterium]HOM50814.1 hypothetical protein [Phycisphaerae bacterium]HPP26011.1 hypothetical protein [Phycisphaerae bacterium]
MRHWFLSTSLLLAGVVACVSPASDPSAAGPPEPVELARIDVGKNVPVVMAKDLDGDGLDELIVADPAAGSYPRSAAGRVRVLSAPVTSGDWSELPALLVLRGEQPFRRFGSALAAVDLDGDGVSDIALRAETSPEGEGTVCVFSGTLRGDHGMPSAAYLTLTGPATLGQGMVAVDYDGNGVDDLVVSCPLRSEVYVVLAPRLGHVRLPQDADAILATQSGSLGWTLAAGDFDGDGGLELAVAEPASDTIYVAPVGLMGRQDIDAIARAVIRSGSATDHLVGADALERPDGGAWLFVRSRRVDVTMAGTLLLLDGPLTGEMDVRRDAYMSLEYAAPVLGASAAWIRPGGDDGDFLVLATPGRSNIPYSNLKGGLWLLSVDGLGHGVLDPHALGTVGRHLPPQQFGLDWLARDLLIGRPLAPNTTHLIATANGAVVVLGWPEP